MDESGIHDGSPVLTVAAYVGMPSVWRDWTKAWNRQKKPIKVFHATDCAALRGEFKDWDKEERDSYVAKLLPVIGQANLLSFVAGIVMDDYNEVEKEYPEIVAYLGNPYTACFQWVVHEIIDGFSRSGIKDRIAFFHEENEFRGDALSCFDFLKKEYYPDRALSLKHGSKQDYVPLQAADILAYEGNKRLRNTKRPDRRAWMAINPNQNRRVTRYFDKKSLNVLMADVRKRPGSYLGPTSLGR